MTREIIEGMREVTLPFVKKKLLEINYENLGKSDAEEFEKHFNEILDLAIKALEQEPRKGHWICDGKGRSFADYHCSECGIKLALCGQDIKQRQDSGYSLFCGGCGADMREVEE